jgi:hypothetical protein
VSQLSHCSVVLPAGATLQTYTTGDAAALVLNLTRASFWVVGDTDLLPPAQRSWWNTKPRLL